MLVMPRTLMTVSEPLTRTSLPVVYNERAGRLPGSYDKQRIKTNKYFNKWSKGTCRTRRRAALESQKVRNTAGTLRRAHSASRKVFKPKLFTKLRFSMYSETIAWRRGAACIKTHL